MSIRLIKSTFNSNYFNCYLNKKNYICSFLNDQSVHNFSHLLCKYKQKYDSWPLFTDEEIILKLNTVNESIPIDEIYKNELIIESHSIDLIINQCIMGGGIGLIGIKDFDYELDDTRLTMMFSSKILKDVDGIIDSRLIKGLNGLL